MKKINNHLVDLSKVNWIALSKGGIYFNIERTGFHIDFDTPEESKEVFNKITNLLV